VEKNGPGVGSRTEDERRPFKNSEACEPEMDNRDLCETGATVGTFRSNVRTMGGSIARRNINVLVISPSGLPGIDIFQRQRPCPHLAKSYLTL
jgi:hypothetical protein